MILVNILAGQVLEVVLAKPQAEKKFDAANPHNPQVPNYIPHPGYAGIPVNPYASMATGYGGAAGFQQVVSMLFCSVSIVSFDCVFQHAGTFSAAYDLWKGANASRNADGANGFTRWSDWLCSVSCLII